MFYAIYNISYKTVLDRIKENCVYMYVSRTFSPPKNSHENFLSNSPFRWLPLNVLKFRYVLLFFLSPHIPCLCCFCIFHKSLYTYTIHIKYQPLCAQYYINGGAAPLIRSIRLDIVYFLFHGPAFMSTHPIQPVRKYIRFIYKIREAQLSHIHNRIRLKILSSIFPFTHSIRPHRIYIPIYILYISISLSQGDDFMNEFSIQWVWVVCGVVVVKAEVDWLRYTYITIWNKKLSSLW